MREETDAELLRRFLQRRDASAFETIFARHRGWVFGVCRRLLRSRALADEATQDVFARCAERGGSLEGDNVAGWLKAKGAEGYLAAEVADAVGIPREAGAELLLARQRGFRDAEVLRIAQVVDGEYLLFMVQSGGEVYFYLSTVRGGLRKALVSLPDRESVTPLGSAEAESNFRREVLYWEQKVSQ